MYENFNGIMKSLYNIFYDLILLPVLKKNLDGVIYKTQLAQDYFYSKGMSHIPSEVIPVGLDTTVFYNQTVCPLDNKMELKLRRFKKRLLYIGVIEKRRNPFFLIDIVEKLVHQDDEYCLVMVGEGPLRSSLVSYIEEKKLKDHVFMIRKLRQNQLPWIYKNTHMFLLPSLYEIFGMVLLESIFFEQAILSSPTAGAKEILKSYENGFISDINIENWLNIISQYFKRVESSTSKTEFPARFEWNNIGLEFISFYKRLF